MREIYRVLAPGGAAIMLTPEGISRDYVNFIQYHTKTTIEELAATAGLTVHSTQLHLMNETGGTSGKDFSTKLSRGLQVILQKPSE